MSKIMKSFAVALLATAAACGTLNEESPARGIADMVKSRFAPTEAIAQAPAPALTRADVDAAPGAYKLMSLVGSNDTATLVPAGNNGTKVTWISADQVSVTLQNGLLVSTRGFVQDLMAADVSGVIQALVSSGGNATRRVDYLDGLDQISTEVLHCSIASGGFETLEILGKAIATEKFNEVCTSESLRFTNVYWISDAGGIEKSQQLVSKGVGFLQIVSP